MAAPLLTNLGWAINQPVERAKVAVGLTDSRSIRPEEWQQVILPGRNFSIMYPFGYQANYNINIPYDTEGQPITLLDLLSTIYDFYQESVDIDEFGQVRDVNDKTYKKWDVVTRAYAMRNLRYFESLTPLGNDVYRLNLATEPFM